MWSVQRSVVMNKELFSQHFRASMALAAFTLYSLSFPLWNSHRKLDSDENGNNAPVRICVISFTRCFGGFERFFYMLIICRQRTYDENVFVYIVPQIPSGFSLLTEGHKLVYLVVTSRKTPIYQSITIRTLISEATVKKITHVWINDITRANEFEQAIALQYLSLNLGILLAICAYWR